MFCVELSQALQVVDRQALETLCRDTGVVFQCVEGKIKALRGDEMSFLEVLDRHRYQLQLIPGQPEQFRAPSRVRIDRV